MSVGETFREIYLCAEHNSHPAGVQIGSLLFAPALESVDPCTGELHGDGLEAQLRGAFANMDRFLNQGGAGREHVARVTVFMTDLAERQLLNTVWAELYPDPADRPPHKYVPARLPGARLVSLQVLAMPGASRRVLTVPGLVHQDPMSMGALTGNLVTSSRIFAGRRVEGEEEHASLLFQSAATLLEQAGGGLENVTQVTAFAGNPSYVAGLERVMRGLPELEAVAPQFHFLEADLGGGAGVPRIEILGLV